MGFSLQLRALPMHITDKTSSWGDFRISMSGSKPIYYKRCLDKTLLSRALQPTRVFKQQRYAQTVDLA